MTGDERRTLRLLVSARRIELVSDVPVTECRMCDRPLTGSQKFFCSDSHRKMFAEKFTEKGRSAKRDRVARRLERRAA